MNGLRVLLIDDDDIVRLSLRDYLEDMGAFVEESRNGIEGLEAFLSGKPDLVISDIRMPLMDGYTLVGKMVAAKPDIPVIVVSGVGTVHEAIKAVRLGAWDFLTKPIENLDNLEIVINRVIERSRILADARNYREQLEDLVQHRSSQLKRSEERYRQLFLQHSDAIILCDPSDLSVIDANPAALSLFRASIARMAARPLSGLFAGSAWELIHPSLPNRNTPTFLNDRTTCVTLDGREIQVSFKSWFVDMGDRSIITCSFRDITEKLRLQDELSLSRARLIQANKMTSLGILVSGMAHEINNPNNFISLNAATLSDIWHDASALLREYHDGSATIAGLALEDSLETGARLIDGIARGSQRIDAVVRGLKDYARNDHAGSGSVVSICRVIEDARILLDHHIQSTTDRFELSCTQGLPAVRGSHQQIEQVLVNLILNALQALQDRTRGVRLDARHDIAAGTVRIRVSDEGYGMAPEVLQHLTEPFYSTRLEDGGTGLGLFISSSIIRDHGGTMAFESEPGKGTVVTIELPAMNGSEVPQ